MGGNENILYVISYYGLEGVHQDLRAVVLVVSDNTSNHVPRHLSRHLMNTIHKVLERAGVLSHPTTGNRT